MNIVWPVTAVVSCGVIFWLVARAVMAGVPASVRAEPAPATHLQRAARWSVGLSLAPALALMILFAAVGAERTAADAPLRMLVYGLFLASLIAAAAGTSWVVLRGRTGTGGVVLDERDRAILERAPVVQSIVTLLALAGWTVALTERFSTSGSVPVALLQLVFWSCVLVNMLGLPVGVLVGYRKA